MTRLIPTPDGAVTKATAAAALAVLASVVASAMLPGRPADAETRSAATAGARAPRADQAVDDRSTADSPIYLPVCARGPVGDLRGVFGLQISEDRFRDPGMVQQARALGADWWRTFVFWDEIERERTRPPTYDWSLYDELLLSGTQQGLRVIAEIQGNPRWVAEYPGGPPTDLDALAQFVAAAVERYDGDGYRDAPGSPRVRFWELYNEPDNVDATLAADGRGWGYWGYEGAEYARMLRRVYPAVKLASPEAIVVFGGVAYDAFVSEDEVEGFFNPEFIDDVLKAGGGPYFDVMNFHYYPLFAPRWQAYGVGVIGKTAAIKDKLARYGLEPPMLLTEAGSWSDASPPYPPTTAEEQAWYVAQLHARAIAAELKTVIWFQLDDVAGTDDPARGLLDRDLARKPAYAAYALTASKLSGVTPASPVRDTEAPGEVYWFWRGSHRVAVAWTSDGSVAHIELRTPGARRTRVTGASHVVRDNADGKEDGLTHVPYGPEPVFVEPFD
ncbi:MAG: hypothetical protein ACK2T6_00055 [Anaerolineae bacterium]|jgi:hypothetical protein